MYSTRAYCDCPGTKKCALANKQPPGAKYAPAPVLCLAPLPLATVPFSSGQLNSMCRILQHSTHTTIVELLAVHAGLKGLKRNLEKEKEKTLTVVVVFSVKGNGALLIKCLLPWT